MSPAGEVVAAAKKPMEKKVRAAKAPKEKKAKATKAVAQSHPPYFQMIKEAIVALHEKTGSSPYAIAKHMEERHKGVLPPNFKKMLAIQLRNLVAKGKLVKVKASFKLSDAGKKESKMVVKEKKPYAPKEKKSKESGVKRKASSGATAPKKKAMAVKKAPKTAAKPRRAGAPAKAKKATPVKPRQPKSIKSPAAKRARKAV